MFRSAQQRQINQIREVLEDLGKQIGFNVWWSTCEARTHRYNSQSELGQIHDAFETLETRISQLGETLGYTWQETPAKEGWKPIKKRAKKGGK